MIIATDGACKRLGKPSCTSTGVAWIMHGETMLFKAHFETESTSQRGEIHGLLEALEYAAEHRNYDEIVVIITDSEYVHNTVMLEWCFKWRDADWTTGSGDKAKNRDLWERVCNLLDTIGPENVILQWTKGHIMSYTPGNVKSAMCFDGSGVELYERIKSIAFRESEYTRIAEDFNKYRTSHDKSPIDKHVAVRWVVMNVTADLLAAYIEGIYDAAYLANNNG